jgi:hypothetical protein
MSNVIQKTTEGGERWDQIAGEYYGDPDKMGKIIQANPGVPIYDILPGGVVLDIPIIEKAEVQTDAEKTPIWKQ